MNRAAVRLLLILVVLAAAVGLLWLLFGPVTTWLAGPDLEQLDARDRIAAISTIRGQVATVLSAAFVAGGLYYTGRKFVLDRDKQYTDRFTSAVNQLGAAEVTVRAGGHRALDRILHDSPRDRDRVLRTVTGYLRTHPTADQPAPDDIVAALAVVRDRGAPPRGQRDVLDLHGATITHTDLSGFDLRGADLTGADLTGSTLVGTDLRGARLDRATLHEADLTDLTFADGRAPKARFTGAVARGADFSRCDLTDAVLTDADLSDADLTGAVLLNTGLDGADLRTARGLTKAQLQRTRRDSATALPPGIG